MEKILFIASIQYGEPPTGGGAQAKNQLLLTHFRKYYDVKFFDTWNKGSFMSLLVSLFYIIFYNRKCVLSISTRGVLSIGGIIQLLHLKRQIISFIIGGDLGKYVESHLNNVPVLNTLDKVLVEGQYMKEQLNQVGVNNVSVVPNFRSIGKLPRKRRNDIELVKFVFLGRLIEEKGIKLIVEAALKVYEKYGHKFSVTFYGTPTKKYSQEYFDTLECNFILYGGFLDLKSQEGLEKLSEYDVMVFPTYFEGEGFPGVLIDAFKAGLPVIASDFHANPDVISNRNLGILIKKNDIVSLCDAMEDFLENPNKILQMSKAVQKEVHKYDIDEVLSNEKLNMILE